MFILAFFQPNAAPVVAIVVGSVVSAIADMWLITSVMEIPQFASPRVVRGAVFFTYLLFTFSLLLVLVLAELK